MKNLAYLLFVLLISGVKGSAQGELFAPFSQSKVSGNVYTGLLIPYTDLSGSDYIGYKPNLAVGAGVGYELIPNLRVRADLMYGTINGNNENSYYESSIFEPQGALEYNLLSLLPTEMEAFKVNLQLGAGMMFYSSRLFDLESGRRIAESPVRRVKSLSPNPFASYGVNVSYAILPKLDINVGLVNRYVLDADYIDSYPGGEAGDHYGMGHVGFVYHLGDVRTAGTVEVDEERFDRLVNESDSLRVVKRKLDETSRELAETEMEQQEQKLKIADLQNKLDSTRAMAITDTIRVEPDAEQQKTASAKEVLETVQYRIVVASMPSRELAQRWIDRTSLSTEKMVIAYAEDVDSYRIIYRSYPTFSAARKEQQSVKQRFPDAWVVKF